MAQIKDFIKKSAMAIKLYEFIFSPVHAVHSRNKIRRESFHHYGNNNKNKVFLVIWNESGSVVGPFSFILFKLGVLKYADDHHMIPVMDMLNHYVPMMQPEEKKGIENAWDYYFEQPVAEYSLEDVYSSSRVYLYKKGAFDIPRYDTGLNLLNSPKDLAKWGYIFNKYIRPNSYLCERIESEYSRFEGKKVLGVAYRAFMDWGLRTADKSVNHHSKVPGLSELIEIIQNKLDSWKCERVFFVTEDRYCHDKISQIFGDKCITVKRPLYNYFSEGTPILDSDYINKELNGYSVIQRNIDYMTEIFLLSKCDSFYATVEGGSICASIINGGRFTNAQYYDEGDIVIP